MEISVIIPAYNAGSSLCATVDSILSSANGHYYYEIVIIDDGSDEPVNDMIESHFLQEIVSGKIKCIRQKNGGVSMARNTGLNAASGKYITFCDADDLVCDTYLDSLFELAQDNPQADIIEYKFEAYKNNVNNIVEHGQVTTSKEGLYSSKEALDNACQAFVWLVMCRLIKSDLARSIQFPVGIRYCEDLIYLYGLYENAKYVFSSKKSLYFYQIGEVSAISKVTLSDCNHINTFLSNKNIPNLLTLLCIKAHLFYMYHSAAKRNLNIIKFSWIMWKKKIGLFNWVKLFRTGKITKRKFLVGVLPFIYYLAYKLKKS
ncbi:glycosyltransferase family A protein [Vibrio salinus]|uniref:glycosyltransferase family A protein n=1 Tax=Vibrio salinus TaxID=2899784 RepID=UPI001E35DC22|nr:glycosyltransferase family 2 protein [Vibrio salinus]MCE0493305.1 glycosyltransferase family 2 protein [Vibrio salinus]